MRNLSLAFAALAMIATPAFAAPCRDAKGHFIKCPKPTAPPTPMAAKSTTATAKKAPCRDSHGRFKKC